VNEGDFVTAGHLFATLSPGIFLGTIARSMPQFGLLMMLVLLLLQILSGSVTPGGGLVMSKAGIL